MSIPPVHSKTSIVSRNVKRRQIPARRERKNRWAGRKHRIVGRRRVEYWLDGMEEKSMTEIATFGAGCFWGIEAAFRRIPGVVDAAVGYSGGPNNKSSIKKNCTIQTRQAGGLANV